MGSQYESKKLAEWSFFAKIKNTWIISFITPQVRNYNHVQNIVDKFTKLTKTSVSLECFNAGFFQFSGIILTVSFLGGRHGTCYQFQAFNGFSCNFIFFLTSQVCSRLQLLREPIHSPFRDNNLVAVHLWWREIVLKCVTNNLSLIFRKFCFLIFLPLKCVKNSKYDHFLAKNKVKPHHNYCPAAREAAFSTKFLLPA